jgi:large subunit ribosomal protein L31
MARTDIQPTWYDDAVVTCACGNTFTTGSTVPKIQVDICAKCHPFFTGQQKFVDTLGQVDKFQQKTKIAAVKGEQKKAILQARAAKVATPNEKPSLKDLLVQARKNLHS